MSLTGKVAVVTGAGRGIGRAVALGFAARGTNLALCSRTPSEVEAVAAEVRARGVRAVAVKADVASPADVEALVAAARRELGPIDVLVNNAGIVARAEVAEMDLATWQAMIDVNLTGVFLLSRAVIGEMLARGKGRIINVSSISGTLGTPGLSAYCAAKHGVIGFTRALAAEVKHRGVQVNALCPGSVDTPMLAQGVPGLEPDMTPDEVAAVVIWLADPAGAPAPLTGSALELFG